MTASNATSTPSSVRVREFSFSDEDFREIRSLVKRVTGISLSEAKRELVYGRLSRRLRALGLRSFGEYRDLLGENADSPELVELSNAITTNLTSFFRESHHFTYLSEQLLQPLARDPAGRRRLRVWSAGCSTGEEPYSIAMTICEALPDLRQWDIKILATDIDSEVLSRARNGFYPDDRVKGMATKRVAAHFRAQQVAGRHGYVASPGLKSLITFKELNLMHALPMHGPLDVVFCRNVIIYFDKDTQRELFARIAPLQRPGDLLFLGHSENLFKVSDAYTLIGKTIYRRNAS